MSFPTKVMSTAQDRRESVTSPDTRLGTQAGEFKQTHAQRASQERADKPTFSRVQLRRILLDNTPRELGRLTSHTQTKRCAVLACTLLAVLKTAHAATGDHFKIDQQALIPKGQGETKLGKFCNWNISPKVGDEEWKVFELAYANKLGISDHVKRMIGNEVEEEDIVYYIWGKGYYQFSLGSSSFHNKSKVSLLDHDVRYHTGNEIARQIKENENGESDKMKEGIARITKKGAHYTTDNLVEFFTSIGDSKVAIVTDFAEGKPTWLYGTNWKDFDMSYDNGNDTQKVYVNTGNELKAVQKLNTADAEKSKNGSKGSGNGHPFNDIRAEWDDNKNVAKLTAIASDMIANIVKAYEQFGNGKDAWSVNILATGNWRQYGEIFATYKDLLLQEALRVGEQKKITIKLTINTISNDEEAEYGSLSFSQIDGFMAEASIHGKYAASLEFGGGSVQVGTLALTSEEESAVEEDTKYAHFSAWLTKANKWKVIGKAGALSFFGGAAAAGAGLGIAAIPGVAGVAAVAALGAGPIAGIVAGTAAAGLAITKGVTIARNMWQNSDKAWTMKEINIDLVEEESNKHFTFTIGNESSKLTHIRMEEGKVLFELDGALQNRFLHLDVKKFNDMRQYEDLANVDELIRLINKHGFDSLQDYGADAPSQLYADDSESKVLQIENKAGVIDALTAYKSSLDSKLTYIKSFAADEFGDDRSETGNTNYTCSRAYGAAPGSKDSNSVSFERRDTLNKDREDSSARGSKEQIRRRMASATLERLVDTIEHKN